MKIFNKDGNVILDIEVDDTSVRHRNIMQENSVTLHYSLTEPIEIPLYSYITHQGEKYTLWRPENFKKDSTRNFQYTLVLGSNQELLKKYKYKNLSEKPYQLKFAITAKPEMLLQLLVDNLNLYDSGWSIGKFIDAPEKLFSVNHDYCWDVLQRMANEFNTEWEIIGKTIHFLKVERPKKDAIELSYGKGNGFVPGVGRQTKGNKAPVTILYVQGGERNIDKKKYGSKSLLLPKSETFEYEGRKYKTDEFGMSIVRADKELKAYNEDSFDGSDIYPMWIGTITDVKTIDAEKNLYDFIDSSIPPELNFNENVIAGETMTVIFQSGIMMGREFDISYVREEKRFEIKPAQMDGFDLPNENLKPSIGDTYAIFHISLPDAYINDKEKGASWRLFRDAVKYFYENEEEQFSFIGELDGIWAAKKWLEIGGKIVPGGYVLFSDPQFQPEGILIRITGVTDYINKPHSPQIELSNAPVGGFVGSELGKIGANEVINENRNTQMVKYSQRRFRDVEELYKRLQDSQLNFTEAINPIAVHAMQMFLGDKNLQYIWINKNNPSVEIDHDLIYDPTKKTLRSPSGTIKHMTLGIDYLTHEVKEEKYLRWDISAYPETYIGDYGALWLYLKCPKSGGTGKFIPSEKSLAFYDDTDYYFLYAHINSEYDKDRSIVTLNGFSEWTPGQMRVNKIIGNDETQYWDMQNRRFKIGGAKSFLSYNVEKPDQLYLKGTIVQSPSGDEDYLEVDRGDWLNHGNSITFYPGDKVKYAGNVYKCIKEHTKNITTPFDTSYWKLLVSKGNDGEQGQDGQGYLYAYYPSNSIYPPTAPPTGGIVPSGLGWWTYPNFNGYRYIYVSQCIKTNGVWGGWTGATLYSLKPEDGDPGPAVVYRGEFINVTPKVFYNNKARRDVVKYGSDYYIFKGTDASTQNYWNSGYWESFGSQFSSVATDLLFTPNGNIGGWIFKNDRMESQLGGTTLNGSTGELICKKGTFMGSIGTPFTDVSLNNDSVIVLDEYFNISTSCGYYDNLTIKLPTSLIHNGKRCNIFNSGISKMSGSIFVKIENGDSFLGIRDSTNVKEIRLFPGGEIGEFLAINMNGSIRWYCINYNSLI